MYCKSVYWTEAVVRLIEMLQEKASAVTDDSVTGVQPGGPPDLSPDPAHLGLPTTPSIPQGNEPDQVIMGIVGSQHSQKHNCKGIICSEVSYSWKWRNGYVSLLSISMILAIIKEVVDLLTK